MFAKHSAGLRSKKLNVESLERRALLAADAMAVGPTQNPAIVEALPSDPNGAQLVSPSAATAGQSPAPGNGNANFALNGPNPTTSTGAMVSSPYLGNNPWLDDVFTMGNNSTPNGSANAAADGPLYQPYFTSMQEYAQYEEAVQAIAAQQAAQQFAANGNLG